MISTIHRLLISLSLFTFLWTACETPDEKIARQALAAQQASHSDLAPDGMAVFRKNCITCHGADGKLGLNGAKDLSASTISVEERIEIITNGKKLMTPFKAVLSVEEIKAVASYTMTLKTAPSQ